MKVILDISAAVTEPHKPISTYPTIDIVQDMEDLRRIERRVLRHTGLDDDHFQSYDDDLYQRGLEGE